jgi:uncharacterized membrane protein YoaK (UPF0700 family)
MTEDTERTRSLWFALLLTLANGFLDAHTYLARGGVFANVRVRPCRALRPGIGAAQLVTVPISFLAAMQIGLFRTIGAVVYLPVATTGNLMRFVEKTPDSRQAFGMYGALIVAFAPGALIGAFASRVWGVHAVWLPAGFLAFTLCLFIIDEHHLR